MNFRKLTILFFLFIIFGSVCFGQVGATTHSLNGDVNVSGQLNASGAAYIDGEMKIAGTYDAGNYKLQVTGNKFSNLGNNVAYRIETSAITGAVGTGTLFTMSVPNDGYAIAAKVTVVGCAAYSNGAESWRGMVWARNTTGALTVQDTVTLTSDAISINLNEPTISFSGTISAVTLNIYLPDTNVRYNIVCDISTYGGGWIE